MLEKADKSQYLLLMVNIQMNSYNSFLQGHFINGTTERTIIIKIKSKAGGVIERWYKEIAKKGHDGPKLLQDAYDMIAKYEK